MLGGTPYKHTRTIRARIHTLEFLSFFLSIGEIHAQQRERERNARKQHTDATSTLRMYIYIRGEGYARVFLPGHTEIFQGVRALRVRGPCVRRATYLHTRVREGVEESELEKKREKEREKEQERVKETIG